MEKHECLIGVYYDFEGAGPVTVDNFFEATWFSDKTIEELTDPESKSPFRWFNYCPICGQRIDKDKVKKKIIEKSNHIIEQL